MKAPTFYDVRAQVGPLANVLAMVASGHEPTKRHLGRLMAIAGKVHGSELPLAIVHSTIGRHAARAVRCAVLHETLGQQWNLLMANIAKGDFDTFNRPMFPKGEYPRLRLPRGAARRALPLGRHPQRQDRQLPGGGAEHLERRAARRGGRHGPVRGLARRQPGRRSGEALEVLRTVHSFDPCLACAIHMVDTRGREMVQVKAV